MSLRPIPDNVSRIRMAISLLVALSLALAAHTFIRYQGFTSVDFFIIHYETENDTLVRLYYGRGNQYRVIHTFENSHAQPAYAGGERRIRLIEKNRSTRNALLEFGTPTVFTIRGIDLINSISDSRHKLRGDELFNTLQAQGNGIAISKSGENTLVTISEPNARARFDFIMQGSNNLLLYGLPLLVFFIILLYGLRFDPYRIPAIGDLYTRAGGITGYRIELDGLRGIAALLVVLEHTWWRFSGSGATGVWIFFALSGYLLSQPFISKPQRALDGQYVSGYIFRRMARILPLYYFTLVLIFGVTDQSHLLLSHLLFLQAEGHLWTIPQELFFYLVLPFLMIGVYFLRKLPTVIFLGLFTLVTGILLFEPDIIGIKLYGYSRYAPPYLGWFLIGMLVAYINPGGEYWQSKITVSGRNLLSFAGITLLVVLLGASSSWIANMVTGTEWILPSKYKSWFSIGGALLMLLILASPGTALSRLFSWTPLRAIGIVGYSFYLIHPLVIDAVMNFTWQYFNYELLQGRLFVVTTTVTWLVCLFTYSLIERPFLLKKRQS